MPARECARMECHNLVHPLAVYRIAGETEEYCSRTCVDIAFEQGRKTRKRKEKEMQVPAQDFGASGVVRHQCDNPRCQKPLGVMPDGTAALAWKGRSGVYCSNRCLKLMENNSMPETETATATASSPISAGSTTPTPSKKKVTPAPAPKSKKATPAKKKAVAPTPKKKAAAPTSKTPAKAPKDPNEVFRAGSTKADIFSLLKDGKKHTREQVYGLIEKAGKSNQLLHWVLLVLPEKGFKVLQNDKDGIQIAKK